jgi:hypothetical protein
MSLERARAQEYLQLTRRRSNLPISGRLLRRQRSEGVATATRSAVSEPVEIQITTSDRRAATCLDT